MVALAGAILGGIGGRAERGAHHLPALSESPAFASWAVTQLRIWADRLCSSKRCLKRMLAGVGQSKDTAKKPQCIVHHLRHTHALIQPTPHRYPRSGGADKHLGQHAGAALPTLEIATHKGGVDFTMSKQWGSKVSFDPPLCRAHPKSTSVGNSASG